MVVLVKREQVHRAEYDYAMHCGAHGCKVGDGCSKRIALWHYIFTLAEHWNEPIREGDNNDGRLRD